MRQNCVFVVAVLLCVGIEIPSSHAQTPVVRGEINPLVMNYGSAVRKSKWAIAAIPVCWENPEAASVKYRAVVKQAAEETWAKYSSLSFTGWVSCEQNPAGIHIRIEDSGPHVKALGRYLDQMPAGMVLNFDFNKWSPSCQSKKESCIYAVAAHEFGHAIGFAHEQNRNDAPLECQAERQGTDGDWNLTEYDPNSIMNYCNPKWNGDGKLSQLDIEAVQTLYGTPE